MDSLHNLDMKLDEMKIFLEKDISNIKEEVKSLKLKIEHIESGFSEYFLDYTHEKQFLSDDIDVNTDNIIMLNDDNISIFIHDRLKSEDICQMAVILCNNKVLYNYDYTVNFTPFKVCSSVAILTNEIDVGRTVMLIFVANFIEYYKKINDKYYCIKSMRQ